MRIFRKSILTGAMLLSALHSLSAKAPAARVVIAGGTLSRPIEITDSEILRLNNGWDTAFLDFSKPPLKEAPKVSATYEVTIYSEIAENDIRKTCVFYYAPGFSSEQGLIYLPGKGALWILNAGTIIRQGRDGKWSYASPVWEASIKPFIAKGQSRSSRAVSDVVVEKWVKPKPGWLYVLDPRSGPHSRVWLLDPETSKVMGTIRAGYDPDFALSPDGSRLYIASGERESGELSAIDTSTGEIHHVPFANRVLYRPWYQGLPPFSAIAVTPDGLAVWILGRHVFSPDRIESRLWIFDVPSVGFQTVDLGNCSSARLIPSSRSDRYEVFCEQWVKGESSFRLIGLDQEQREISNPAKTPGWPRRCDFAEIFSPRGNSIAVIRTDGAIYEADSALQNLNPTSVAGDCREWRIAYADWPRSPDGTKLYLGYGGIAPDGLSAATELDVFEASTWKQLGRVQTSIPFWSAGVSHDGKQIYAVAPKQHKVLIIDAFTLQEKRVVDIGGTPSLAVVAP